MQGDLAAVLPLCQVMQVCVLKHLDHRKADENSAEQAGQAPYNQTQPWAIVGLETSDESHDLLPSVANHVLLPWPYIDDLCSLRWTQSKVLRGNVFNTPELAQGAEFHLQLFLSLQHLGALR
jgi:hypothetical protein